MLLLIHGWEELHKSMKHFLIGLLFFFFINPVGFVGAQNPEEPPQELKSRACVTENFEEDELNKFSGLEDLKLLVFYIELKEKIEYLTKIRAVYILDPSSDPGHLYQVGQGIVNGEESRCLLILEMTKRELSIPDGFDFKNYDISDPDFSEKLARDLKVHEDWSDVSAQDVEAARSPDDGTKDGFAYGHEEDTETDPNASCAGGQCSDENTGQNGGNNSSNQGNGDDDGDSDKLKKVGLAVAAAAAADMIGGAGGSMRFNLPGIFQPGGILGDGGSVDGMLQSAGINLGPLFADTRPEAIIRNQTNESLSRVGAISGQPSVLYGPGVKGGTAQTGQYLTGSVSKINLRDTLLGWARMLTSIAAILAVVAVIWGGVLMISSVGDDGRRDLGKKVILYAIVGLFLMAGAYALVNLFIQGRFA